MVDHRDIVRLFHLPTSNKTLLTTNGTRYHYHYTHSSGLGYQLAIEALNRGDKVIATTRASSLNSSAMDELKAHGANILELDVTAPMETLRGVAEEAVGIYGRVDVLVNNAGYLQSGTVEEVTPEEAFNQYK